MELITLYRVYYLPRTSELITLYRVKTFIKSAFKCIPKNEFYASKGIFFRNLYKIIVRKPFAAPEGFLAYRPPF